MKKMELIAPCHFGLETVLKREIVELGYEIAAVEELLADQRFLPRKKRQ